MNKAVIALGSNIEPGENTTLALQALSRAFKLIDKSRFFYTAPIGYQDQPDFFNGAVLVETTTDKSDVVARLKMIEQRLGRTRDGHPNGPRRIDLDLILFNDEITDEDVYERPFLRRFIGELRPGFAFPSSGSLG